MHLQVTFELGLSAQEKSARAATQLPYTEQQTAAADVGGQIHYTPDDVDDWDDEDPDDDLDV